VRLPLLAALEVGRDAHRGVPRAQMPRDLDLPGQDGVALGLRWNALDAVGLYVPGGKAAYPSSVLMNALAGAGGGGGAHRHGGADAGRRP
jgi:histidinol dehydrogenase